MFGVMTQRYGQDGSIRLVSVEWSLPPYALQLILPSTFHGRYNDGNESATPRSTFPAHKTDGR